MNSKLQLRGLKKHLLCNPREVDFSNLIWKNKKHRKQIAPNNNYNSKKTKV